MGKMDQYRARPWANTASDKLPQHNSDARHRSARRKKASGDDHTVFEPQAKERWPHAQARTLAAEPVPHTSLARADPPADK